MKKIVINPSYLKLTQKKRQKKEKPTTFKANKIKQAFLEKIKNHQKNKKYGEKFKENLEFENEFEKALKYLDKVQVEKKIKKKDPQINDPPKKTTDDPPWGVLKNGNKPLYRDYHRTLKKKETRFEEPTERKRK